MRLHWRLRTDAVSLNLFDQLGDHNYPVRMLAMAVVGAIGALFLTWFMHLLLNSSKHQFDESGRAHMVDFVRLKRDESSVKKEHKPDKPVQAEAPPMPDTPEENPDTSNTNLSVSISAPGDLNAGLQIGGLGFGGSEGDYLPIVKIAPVYPHAGLVRGTEGECVVQYTVTVTGTTRDVEVIKDRCDQPMFHRPSIQAAKRFKYKPRIIDGEAVEVHGVKNRFDFKIVKEK